MSAPPVSAADASPGRTAFSAPAAVPARDLGDWASAYRDRLLAAACALCGDRVEAEDLLQETFSEAARALPGFEGRSAPYTWLYGILRRRFLLQCRRRRRFRRWAALAGVPEAEDRDSGRRAGADADSVGESDPRLDSIAAALRNLPPKHREILQLRYVEGRKIAEIARLVDASEGTVKSRLHHALRRVRGAVVGDGHIAVQPAEENANEV